MVLFHLSGETIYFPNHQVTLQASVLDHPNYELYSSHDSATSYTVKYESFEEEYEISRTRYYREEVTLHKLQRNPCIIPLCDSIELTDREHSGFHLFDCSITSSLRTFSQSIHLSDSQIFSILKDLCEALHFVHSSGYLHRNLSLDSLFQTQNGSWLLGDFSASMPINYQLSDVDSYRDVELMTVQTLRAPEQLDISTVRSANQKADMWAVGCVLYELMAGQPPFTAAKRSEQQRGIFAPLGDNVNPKLAELVGRLLALDASQRLSAQEIVAYLQTIEARVGRPAAINKGSLIGNLLKTSTRSWIDNATSTIESMPEIKYVDKLIAKAWQKPAKIEKFYHFLNHRPLVVTIVAIKSLLLFHNYLCAGPKEVVSSRAVGHEKFLSQVEEIWTNPGTISVPDPHRCEYFNGLIRQYCKLLKVKANIMLKFPLTGSWEGELTVGAREVEQFIAHWNRLNHFVKGLFLGVPDLPELRTGLAQLQLEEMFNMMRVVRAVVDQLLSLGVNPRLDPLVKGFNEEIGRSQFNVSSLLAHKATAHVINFESYLMPLQASQVQQYQSAKKPPGEASESPGGFASNQNPQNSGKVVQQPSNYDSSGGEPPAIQGKAEPQKEEPRPQNKPEPPSSSSLHANPATSPQREKPSASLRAEPPKQVQGESPRPSDPKPQQQPRPIALDPSQFSQIEASWVIKESQLVQNEVIGGGSSCTVYKGTYKRTAVAIKVLRSVLNGDHLKEFSRELSALLHLRHPNLVLFMGALFNPQLAIVTEFCAGDTLFKLLHQEKHVQLNWKQKLKMCRDVAHGMTYLHESEPPILHRDLKSLNLLLTDQVTGPGDSVMVKITDFGVSKFLDESVGMMNTGQMGTCHWMAPEVLAGHHYSLPADVYSYGIVLWEIVCRDTPYRGLNPTLIPYRVLNCNERPNLAMLPSSCPEALKTLIIRCWQTDPSLRPTFPSILDTLETIDTSGRVDNLLL